MIRGALLHNPAIAAEAIWVISAKTGVFLGLKWDVKYILVIKNRVSEEEPALWGDFCR